jgi:hypothetical protein
MRATWTARVRRLTVESRGHQPPPIPRAASRLQPFVVGFGLAGLLGATAYAVASVSGWLVPVYVLLVIVILTAPRGVRAASKPAPPHPIPLPDGARAIGGLLRRGLNAWRRRSPSPSPPRGEGARRADEGVDADATATTSQPGRRPDEGPDRAGEAAEAEAKAEAKAKAKSARRRIDPAATDVAKPRTSRARSRKAAKPAAEPVGEPAPATWIRVGPGQYVRSDAVPQGQPSPEAPPPVEEPAPAVAPEIDPSPPAETTPESATAPEVVPDLRCEPEEHGIAPSTFEVPQSSVPSSPVLESLVLESSVPNSEVPVEHRRSATKPRGPFAILANVRWPNRRRQRSRASGPQGLKDSRTQGRTGRRRRDPRLADAARRAFARTEHVRRTWRARSPP